MKTDINYSLYLCTDRSLMSCASVEECVERAIAGGVSVVQLREKNCSSRDFYEEALRLREMTRKHGVTFIVNDRVDIALAAGADGIHVGQSDLPCAVVRQMVGPDMIIGVSAKTVAMAREAEQAGANYLGVGAIYPTATKKDTSVITLETLEAIRAAVSIPIVAIGGIKRDNLAPLKGKADGIVVVSAIVAQPDIEAAARELRTLWTTP
ncbi:MAG: thiamine phosphate synthase [Deltaproteobacteria bacterium]|nr:thiamine phosphate synthase [Deltaproteobacteria bacterium]